MKKYLKIFCLLMMIMNIMMIFSNFSLAWQQSMIGEADSVAGEWAASGEITKNVKSVMGTAIEVIRIVGTGISIIMLTYIAIKYMSAAPNQKSEFKKSATGYILGAVVLFASTNILNLIVDFALAVTTTDGGGAAGTTPKTKPSA